MLLKKLILGSLLFATVVATAIAIYRSNASARHFVRAQQYEMHYAELDHSKHAIKMPPWPNVSDEELPNVVLFLDDEVARTGQYSLRATVANASTALTETPWPAGWFLSEEEVFRGAKQSIVADRFRGKHIRLTGHIKTKDVVGPGIGCWLRIDSPTRRSFDNMDDRLVRGTNDWTSFTITLHVPNDAIGISFGLYCSQIGAGEVWIDDLHVEAVQNVEATRASTRTDDRSAFLKRVYCASGAQPESLGFEETGGSVVRSADFYARTYVDRPYAIWLLTNYLVSLKRLHEAEAFYDRLMELCPDTEYVWLRAATIQLFNGHEEKHRATCNELLDRFFESSVKTGHFAGWMAKISNLSPHEVTDKSREAKLVRVHVASRENNSHPMWIPLTQGLMQYRLGEFDSAVTSLEQAQRQLSGSDLRSAIGGQAHASAMLGLALQQLGRNAEANVQFQRAIGLVRPGKPLERGDDLNALMARIALREAGINSDDLQSDFGSN